MKSQFALSMVLVGACLAQQPMETEFRAKLLSPIDTRSNKPGDQVNAQVLAPESHKGAFLAGQIRESKGGKKVKGEAALSFTFDQLVQGEIRTPVQATVRSVVNSQGKVNVDEEGRAVRKKNNLGKVAAVSAAGAVLGGLAGGARGAAIGAGAGVAAGLIVTQIAVEGAQVSFAAGSEFVLGVRPSRGGQ